MYQGICVYIRNVCMVEPLYDMAYYNMVLDTEWQWQMQYIRQTMSIQMPLHTSPSEMNYKAFCHILEENYYYYLISQIT